MLAWPQVHRHILMDSIDCWISIVTGGWIYSTGSKQGRLGVWLRFSTLISILGVCASVLAVFSAVSWEGCASSGGYATRAAYATHWLQRPCMQHTHTWSQAQVLLCLLWPHMWVSMCRCVVVPCDQMPTRIMWVIDGICVCVHMQSWIATWPIPQHGEHSHTTTEVQVLREDVGPRNANIWPTCNYMLTYIYLKNIYFIYLFYISYIYI